MGTTPWNYAPHTQLRKFCHGVSNRRASAKNSDSGQFIVYSANWQRWQTCDLVNDGRQLLIAFSIQFCVLHSGWLDIRHRHVGPTGVNWYTILVFFPTFYQSLPSNCLWVNTLQVENKKSYLYALAVDQHLPEQFMIRQKFFKMSWKKLLLQCQTNKGTSVAECSLYFGHLPHISTKYQKYLQYH